MSRDNPVVFFNIQWERDLYPQDILEWDGGSIEQ